MTQFVNFSTIKGMTESKNFKKVMVGSQNFYINLDDVATTPLRSCTHTPSKGRDVSEDRQVASGLSLRRA